MFVWCAYCQRFSGERAPFHDLSLTHGLCDSCKPKAADVSDEQILALRDISAFHQQVLVKAIAGLSLPDVVGQGRKLGMRPLDLLVGILQPVLYELGTAWAAGRISPATEAAFSRECERVLEVLQAEMSVPPDGPRVLLMAAHFNRHTLGLRMKAFELSERGYNVRVLSPTPPIDELRLIIATEKPAIVGVSVAAEWQLGFLAELVGITESLGVKPRVVVGGLAVRDGVRLPAGVEAA